MPSSRGHQLSLRFIQNPHSFLLPGPSNSNSQRLKAPLKPCWLLKLHDSTNDGRSPRRSRRSPNGPSHLDAQGLKADQGAAGVPRPRLPGPSDPVRARTPRSVSENLEWLE